MAISILMRTGKEKDALQIGAPHIPQWASFDMLRACAGHRPLSQIAMLAANVQTSKDPEANYLAAAQGGKPSPGKSCISSCAKARSR